MGWMVEMTTTETACSLTSVATLSIAVCFPPDLVLMCYVVYKRKYGSGGGGVGDLSFTEY